MPHGILHVLANRHCSRPLAFVLSIVIYWTGINAAFSDHLTDPIADAAAHGQGAGNAFVPPPDIATSDNQGNITLFPNGANPTNIPASEMFPGATGDFSTYTNTYGNDAAMQQLGTETQSLLENEQSYPGEAYRTVIDSRVLSLPNMRNDPVWVQTDNTLNNLATIAADFSECTATTTTTPGSIVTHVPDYRTCERVSQPPTSCSLQHDVTVQDYTLTIHAGAYMRLYATIDVDLKTGIATVDPAGTEPDGPTIHGDASPTLDYNTICGQTGGSFNFDVLGTWDWPVDGYPYDASFVWNVVQYPSCENQLVAKIRVADTGGSAWYFSGVEMRVRFWRKTSDTWQWSQPDCPNVVQAIQDGFCTGTVQCTQNNSNCMTIGGVTLCDGQLEPAPAPTQGIPNGCIRAEVNANCAPNGTLECYTDVNGVLRCPQNTGGNPNGCATLESNPSCGFISSQCLDGTTGASGTCYVREETWDCGVTTSVPTSTTGTTYTCTGPIRCMGNECVTQVTENNPDFARALGALNTAQHIATDNNCLTQASQNGGHYDVSTCTIFSGEPYECKRAVGGIVDCCETPGGVSLADYITLIYKLNDAGAFETAAEWALEFPPIRGSWETLRAGWDSVSGTFTDAWSSVSDWFGSAWNSMGGGTTAAASEQAASLSLDQFKQQIMQAAADWTRDMFGDAVADALFTETGGSVALNQSVTNGLQTLSTIFMYYMIAMLIIQIVWECEERELELGAKRELRLCHRIGSYCRSRVASSCIESRTSYCCFSSPLSRIIQEQVRPQFPAMTWGTPQNPQCGGLTIDQLAQVDWSAVNLDEWIGILNLAGHYPNASNMNLDSLTGSGHTLNVDGTRQNAQQRAVQRIGDDLDTTGARINAGQELR